MKFQFLVFGRKLTVWQTPTGVWYGRGIRETYMSLDEFRKIFGLCSVVGCDHLTLGDYLPIA